MHRLIKTCLFNLSRFIAASQMSRLPHLQTEDSSMFGIQRATAGSSVQIGCCCPGPCCRSPWGNTTASCSHRVSLIVVKKAPLSFMLHHCISSQMLLSFFQVVRCIHLESFYGGIWASPCLLRCQRSLCWERRWSVWLLAASTAVHWASRVASTCGGRILQDSVGKQRRVQSQTSPVS